MQRDASLHLERAAADRAQEDNSDRGTGQNTEVLDGHAKDILFNTEWH